MPEDYSIKRKVETAFADFLNERAMGPRCYTSKADEEDVALPYIAVLVKEAKEIIPRSNAYEIDLRIVLVSSISQATSDDHELLVAKVKCALDEVPQKWERPALGLFVNGFCVTAVNSSGSDQDECWGDIWTVRAGAQG